MSDERQRTCRCQGWEDIPVQVRPVSEFEQLRRERDEALQEANAEHVAMQCHYDRAEAAEAEVSRLQQELDEARERLTTIRHTTVARLCAEKDQVETQVSRLQAALEEIITTVEREPHLHYLAVGGKCAAIARVALSRPRGAEGE